MIQQYANYYQDMQAFNEYLLSKTFESWIRWAYPAIALAKHL